MGQVRKKSPSRPVPRTRRAKRRPQQRSLDTRDRLVDAALQEFATHGFDGATTREIAQRAGMAPIGRPEHLHYMLIGAASSVYALAAEFELLTGTPASEESLVAEHIAALERMFFPTTS